MSYSVTYGKPPLRPEPTPDKPLAQLTYKHAASYAAKIIRNTEVDQDLTMTIWDGTTEAVDIKLLVGTAKVWVDADVYSAKPHETAYIKAAVDNAVSDWRVRRSEVRPG
ncbi:MAG: hypothetical protein WC977_07525 [Anaerovoracaceae bacterium]